MTVHNPLSFHCISIKAVMVWLKTSQSQYNLKAQIKMSVFMLGDNGKFRVLPGHHNNQLQLA